MDVFQACLRCIGQTAVISDDCISIIFCILLQHAFFCKIGRNCFPGRYLKLARIIVAARILGSMDFAVRMNIINSNYAIGAVAGIDIPHVQPIAGVIRHLDFTVAGQGIDTGTTLTIQIAVGIEGLASQRYGAAFDIDIIDSHAFVGSIIIQMVPLNDSVTSCFILAAIQQTGNIDLALHTAIFG